MKWNFGFILFRFNTDIIKRFKNSYFHRDDINYDHVEGHLKGNVVSLWVPTDEPHQAE